MTTREILRSAAILIGSIVCLLTTNCVRIGNLGTGAGGVLEADARRLQPGDPAAPGPRAVVAQGLVVDDARLGEESGSGDLPVALYRPANQRGPAPAVVFLPGRVAPESAYESYARALASRGFVVAVRGWYSPFVTDRELSADARRLARWLVDQKLADPRRIGVAGHSMGGKDAILAAAGNQLFNAVVAIDPDDNGRLSVAKHVIDKLVPPLLLIGAEVAWKGANICAPKATNYETFFARAPAGTVQLELRGADHVQVMDDPNSTFGICRVGTADSNEVRRLSRGAVVSFFVEKLLGEKAPALELGTAAVIRVKSDVQVAAKSAPAGPYSQIETLNARSMP